jgi:hypothetical protein
MLRPEKAERSPLLFPSKVFNRIKSLGCRSSNLELPFGFTFDTVGSLFHPWGTLVLSKYFVSAYVALLGFLSRGLRESWFSDAQSGKYVAYLQGRIAYCLNISLLICRGCTQTSGSRHF